MFLADGGCENTNSNVASLLESLSHSLVHKIAQNDVLFSNSMIEAFKYEFLYLKTIASGLGLKKLLEI